MAQPLKRKEANNAPWFRASPVGREPRMTVVFTGRSLPSSACQGLKGEALSQHRANDVVGRRMDFSSDANANFEGLLAVNQGSCMPQMAEKASPDTPPNGAVAP